MKLAKRNKNNGHQLTHMNCMHSTPKTVARYQKKGNNGNHPKRTEYLKLYCKKKTKIMKKEHVPKIHCTCHPNKLLK